MRFDLVRQPLIPAFLGLVILLVLALCHTASGGGVSYPTFGISAAELPLPAFGGVLEQFAQHHAGWAHTLAGFCLLFSAMSIGRMTARFKLYGISTFIAMPLYMLSMMGVMGCNVWFSAVVTSTFLTLSVKNFCYSFRNGFSFDAVLRGGIYLALVLLLMPKAAPLVLVMPLAMILFRRATRETLVATFGFLLPPFVWAYLNWAVGGSFVAPFKLLYHLFMEGEWLFGVLQFSIITQLFGAILLLLNLLSVILFSLNSYALSTRSRHTLIYTTYLLLCCAALLLVPGVQATMLALLAVPSALMLPVLFIRVRRSLAQILYLLFAAASIAALVMAC